jgi:hypothetical protein
MQDRRFQPPLQPEPVFTPSFEVMAYAHVPFTMIDAPSRLLLTVFQLWYSEGVRLPVCEAEAT